MVMFALVLLLAFSTEISADCDVIPISDWGKSANLRTEKLQEPVNLVVVQHTAIDECHSDQECVERMIYIRDLQKTKYHFNDVGNSFFISSHGKIYEGSGWNLVGAHTKNYNTKSIGISFIGNFQSKLPTEAAISAFNKLVACGITSQHLSSDYRLVAHSQLSNTKSPGDILRDAVKTWAHWTDKLSS